MEMEKIQSYKKATGTLGHLYAFVEENPVINIEQASKGLGIAYNTAAKYIEILQELGILKKSKEQLRNRLYYYDRLLRIFQLL